MPTPAPMINHQPKQDFRVSTVVPSEVPKPPKEIKNQFPPATEDLYHASLHVTLRLLPPHVSCHTMSSANPLSGHSLAVM